MNDYHLIQWTLIQNILEVHFVCIYNIISMLLFSWYLQYLTIYIWLLNILLFSTNMHRKCFSHFHIICSGFGMHHFHCSLYPNEYIYNPLFSRGEVINGGFGLVLDGSEVRRAARTHFPPTLFPFKAFKLGVNFRCALIKFQISQLLQFGTWYDSSAVVACAKYVDSRFKHNLSHEFTNIYSYIVIMDT